MDKPTQHWKRSARMPVLGLAAFLALAAAGTVGGCGKKAGGDPADAGVSKPGAGSQAATEQATPVTVTPAAEQTVTRTVPVTGSVAALQSVTLSPKVAARVVSVAGREGDSVRAGEVVVQQDTADLQNQLETAQANLQSAQAKRTQAQTNYQLQQSTSATNVQNAQSALSEAQSSLALARQPQRTEQVQQARIAVQQAQANYDRAVADRKRYEYLVQQGAAAQATLDQYSTAEAVQKANLQSAQENLKISQTGGRPEQIQASQQAVQQARIALQQARANVAQNQARQDDVRQAQAAIAQTEAQVDIAKQALADASIRSPISGVIATRTTEPGQQAAPGVAVMTVVSLKTVYFQAQVPETQLQSLQEGQAADVRVDSFPSRVFRGKIAQVYPTGSTSSRTFNVRVDMANDAGLLKPGMFARGQFVLERRRGVVVPKDALVSSGVDGDNSFQVFVAENGARATKRAVKVGIQTDAVAEILSGVKTGDDIIVSGQDGLKDGAPIRIESGAATPTQQQAALAQ